MLLQAGTPALILASASPARRALLRDAGLRFESHPATLDEGAIKRPALRNGVSAADTALLLADRKATQIATSEPEAVVIGADQILVCDGDWFDKPATRAAAGDHLRRLRGKTHVLETAVICRRGPAPAWSFLAQPRLTMRDFSDDFVERYLDAEGDDVFASVGGYRLEGRGVHLFERIEGDHTAILGLPLLPLLAFLRRCGVVRG